jgi:pimeloyl-ACP methyl ester carboxylesterase
MGGGEVARYIGNYGEADLHSVVFAAAVPPYLMKSEDNPRGPLTAEKAREFEAALRADRDAFFDGFTKDFFSANGKLMVSEPERREALALCKQSDPAAALGCMKAWATTDFRADLARITVPTLVLHGDADATVPFEGSGARTHAMVKGSALKVVLGGPHGLNVSHASEFNAALVTFLTGVRETTART